MSDYAVDSEVLICPKCDKGREVCTLCWNQDWTIFKQICHCGLVQDGEHTIPCEMVTDEQAHATLQSSPRLDAEAERGWHRLISEGWSEADDALVGELLAEQDDEG